jgi:hypothetical protein
MQNAPHWAVLASQKGSHRAEHGGKFLLFGDAKWLVATRFTVTDFGSKKDSKCLVR